MNELNKKLAEWRWPNTQVYIPKAGGEVRVRGSNGLSFQYALFTESLDACFEWLVPKLEISDGWQWDMLCEWFYNALRNNNYKNSLDKTALAFCLAIEELIDSEVK